MERDELKRPRSKRLQSYMQAFYMMEEETVVHGIDGVFRGWGARGSSIRMCLVVNVGDFHEMPKTLHQISFKNC